MVRLTLLGQCLLIAIVYVAIFLSTPPPFWLMGYIGFMFALLLFQILAHFSTMVGQYVARATGNALLFTLLFITLMILWIRGLVAAPIGKLPSLIIYLPFALLCVPLAVYNIYYLHQHPMAVTKRVAESTISFTIVTAVTIVGLELTLRAQHANLPGILQIQIASVGEGTLVPFPPVTRPGGIFREYPIKGDQFASRKVYISNQSQMGGLLYNTCAQPLPENPTPITTNATEVRFDGFGFRYQNFPIDGDPDVVVLGDSFSVFPSTEPIYWANLTTNTLSLARAETGTIEQSIILERFIVEQNKQPDVVVLQYFEGNDIRENQRFTNDVAAGGNLDRYHPYELTYSYHLADLYISRRFRSTVPSNSFDVDPCPYPVVDEYGHPLAFLHPYISLLTLPKADIEQSNEWHLTTNALTSIKEMTEQMGAELVIVYVPTKLHVHMDGLSDEQILSLDVYLRAFTPTPSNLFQQDFSVPKRDVVSLIRQNATGQRDLVTEFTKRNDILFLDMTPHFQETVREGEPVYFWLDTHWNQLGSDLTRQELIQFLIENNLLVNSLTQ